MSTPAVVSRLRRICRQAKLKRGKHLLMLGENDSTELAQYLFYDGLLPWMGEIEKYCEYLDYDEFIKEKLYEKCEAIYGVKLLWFCSGETAYSDIQPPKKKGQHMDFSEALKAIKMGKAVYQILDPGRVIKSRVKSGNTLEQVVCAAESGKFVEIWRPTIEEVMAEDWRIDV